MINLIIVLRPETETTLHIALILVTAAYTVGFIAVTLGSVFLIRYILRRQREFNAERAKEHHRPPKRRW